MATTYDEIIYPSYSYPQSHPEHLATIARLFDLCSPPIDGCRVLELGCAAGGNLLPMAEMFSNAHFIGIDLSARQIELGQAAVRALGLTNVEFRTISIMDVTPDWGQFDYILCHGIYSWVPDEVQDKILDICRHNLAPKGVGYISYNTYPGWHMRGMLREIMCFHAARFTQPEEQIREARMLLDFLAEASAGDGTPNSLLLRQETQFLRQQSDAYLYHDHMEEHNSPCYFFEFAQKVRAVGLQYLGDALFPSMFARNYPPKIAATLNHLASDLIQLEQYLDFVRNRMFRASLVCAMDVPLVRDINVDLLQQMHLSSTAVRQEFPAKDVQGKNLEGVTFVVEGAGTVTTADPIPIAALEVLGRAWPESVEFDQLANSLVAAGTIDATKEARHRLATVLMDLLAFASISASLGPARCTGRISGPPKVTALARYLAAKEGWLPTRRHTVCRVDDLGRRLVPLLNGQRTRDEVIDILLEDFRAGKMSLQHEGEMVRDSARARELLAAALTDRLELLRRAGALVG